MKRVLTLVCFAFIQPSAFSLQPSNALQPSVSEAITVTATRTESRVADTPASVVVLSRETLDVSAAPTTDEALRQVPGFTLFRRTGSRVANPTAQGVSLRGIGASGASRALVLDDGIPLNDPFGGWVYWGRVPRRSIERMEVLRGGGSDLYGNAAMSGVIQFVRRRDDVVTAEASGGNESTGSGSVYASGSLQSWRGSIGIDVFDTAGYVLVNDGQRGTIDRAADSRYRSFDTTVARDRLFIRASHYDESRNNGTPMQVNDTTIRQIAAGGDVPVFNGQLSLRAWLGDQDYFQTFSAVAADRSSERLTVEQSVPSDTYGASAQWSRVIGTHHALLTGADVRDVSGTSDETQIAFNGTRTRVATSGSQRLLGAFIEDIYAPTSRLSITAGVRYDGWQNSESAFSPRLAVLYRPSNDLGFTAGAYQAFRAPTLNELYRGFRVGNVVTLANADLTAEHLTGFEAGVRLRNVRMTAFWMSMEDVVANVTLTTTPTLITRQRQNVATSESRGMELEGEWRFRTNWRTSAGYLFTDAITTSGALDGFRLPQVPRHQVTAQVSYDSPTTVAVQTRWSDMQYDDDLNSLRLDSYFVVDAFVSRRLVSNLDLTLAAENVFDTEIETAATPVITVGQPRAFRVGLRYGR
nr:TonB dependent receptor [uncultured bacterium]